MQTPNPHAAIDFESYYDKELSITTLGTYTYLRTIGVDQVHTVAIYYEDVDGNAYEFVGPPAAFDWTSIKDLDWVSHNRSFDKAVYDFLVEEGVIETDVFAINPDTQWFCTADLAAWLRAKRNLKDAVKQLLGADISKDIRTKMKGLTVEMMKGLVLTDKNKLVAIDDIPNYDGPSFYDLMLEYALFDVRWCHRLWRDFGDRMPLRERRLSWLTTTMSHRGFMVDSNRVDAGLELTALVKRNAINNLPWAEEGDEEGVLSQESLAMACRDFGIEPPKSLDKSSKFLREWEEANPSIRWTVHMRAWRRANLMEKKLLHLRDRRKPDGRFPYAFMYGGAQTMRWSGGSRKERGGTGEKGINVQNFLKGKMWVNLETYELVEDEKLTKNLDKLAKDEETYRDENFPYAIYDDSTASWYEFIDFRACVIPGPGKKFVICDLAQIEPRVIKWLAGDEEALTLMASGMSPYEVHARQTMGWTGGDIKKEDPEQQFLAKQRVLGLGYGCGKVKFRDRCAELGFEISLKDSAAAVKEFRAKERRIKGLWDKLGEDMFNAAISTSDRQNPERMKAALARGRGTWEIELPSGRSLVYFDVMTGTLSKEERDKRAKTRAEHNHPEQSKMVAMDKAIQIKARDTMGDTFNYYYGGKILENVVQAIARDGFAEGMLAVEDAGHDTIFTVHDEGIYEVDLDVPAAEIEELHRIKDCPWLELNGLRLPVDAEAHESYYYDK